MQRDPTGSQNLPERERDRLKERYAKLSFYNALQFLPDTSPVTAGCILIYQIYDPF